jgi:hypothetical protein
MKKYRKNALTELSLTELYKNILHYLAKWKKKLRNADQQRATSRI